LAPGPCATTAGRARCQRRSGGEAEIRAISAAATSAIGAEETVLYRVRQAEWKTFFAERESTVDSPALPAFVVSEGVPPPHCPGR
jgi:hypothetical protein